MGGIDASHFMTQIRKSFKSDNDYDVWLNENLFFKTFKILIKAKQETFKGDVRQRFYALDVQKVTVEDDQLSEMKQAASNLTSSGPAKFGID